MKYFAYGSNMSLRRLQARVPSAQRIATGSLVGHQLRFHKRGRDGSAKCDAYQTAGIGDRVFGALFLLNPNEKGCLDRAEGLGVGYREKSVLVHSGDGQVHQAFTYVALQIDAQLKPYHWYLEHVLIGARESRLPAEYLMQLTAIEALTDPDAEREQRERAIYTIHSLTSVR
ncbi:gamma-glutamylcyclotransferase [Marinobacter hydrocarbonoclasticus]|nr:gamma-glutamylcyclotransferase [Marinobacter nauticus]